MSDYMNDHARGCQGREYICTCGYDDERDRRIEALQAELAKAREAALEEAAQLIDANIIKDTSAGKTLAPRQDGNRDGQHYAVAIRALQQKEREA